MKRRVRPCPAVMGNTCGVAATDPVSPAADVTKPAADPAAPAAHETRTASGTADAEQSSNSTGVAAEPPPSAAEEAAAAGADAGAEDADGAADGDAGEQGEEDETPRLLPSASPRGPKGRRMSGLTRTPTGLEGATKTPERRSSRVMMNSSGKIEAALLEDKAVEGLALAPLAPELSRDQVEAEAEASASEDDTESGDDRSARGSQDSESADGAPSALSPPSLGRGRGGAPKRGGLNRQNTGVGDMNKGPQRRSSQAFMVENKKIHNTILDGAEPPSAMKEEEEGEEEEVEQKDGVSESREAVAASEEAAAQ